MSELVESMLVSIARYLCEKVGIDYDKLVTIINSIEIYEDQDNVIHIHIKNPTSFQNKIEAPEINVRNGIKQDNENS